MQEYLEIGQIVTTHGIKGEVRVKPWCDSSEILTCFEKLYFDKGKTEAVIENARVHKNIVIMKLAGIEDMNSAAALRNRILYVKREDFPLPEGTYFVADLLGLEVKDKDSGKTYGKLTDVLKTGANDIYEVTQDSGRKIYIPKIPETDVEIDFNNSFISVRMLKGLIDDAD